MDWNSYNAGRAAAYQAANDRARWERMSPFEKRVYRFLCVTAYCIGCGIASYFLFDSPSATFPTAQYYLAIAPVAYVFWAIFQVGKAFYKQFK